MIFNPLGLHLAIIFLIPTVFMASVEAGYYDLGNTSNNAVRETQMFSREFSRITAGCNGCMVR